MIYQDTWVNGKCVAKGQRDCDNRYEIIKPVCAKYHTGFSVLDIGANMCYFGLRLIEDFNCTVMAFEFNSFEMRERIVGQNKTDRLILLKRKLTIQDIRVLSNSCHFDLVLMMSVLHHLPGNSTEWISAVRKIGDNVIIEFALEDSTRPQVRSGYKIPDDAAVIGYGDSHLKKDFKRPIVLITK